MKKKMPKMDFGKELVASLQELHDAVVSGDTGRLTIRRVELPDDPRTFKAADVRHVRDELNMSQAVFAKVVGISPVLVRAWEGGQRAPSKLACRLLEEIEARPKYWRRKVRAD